MHDSLLITSETCKKGVVFNTWVRIHSFPSPWLNYTILALAMLRMLGLNWLPYLLHTTCVRMCGLFLFASLMKRCFVECKALLIWLMLLPNCSFHVLCFKPIEEYTHNIKTTQRLWNHNKNLYFFLPQNITEEFHHSPRSTCTNLLLRCISNFWCCAVHISVCN